MKSPNLMECVKVDRLVYRKDKENTSRVFYSAISCNPDHKIFNRRAVSSFLYDVQATSL